MVQHYAQHWAYRADEAQPLPCMCLRVGEQQCTQGHRDKKAKLRGPWDTEGRRATLKSLSVEKDGNPMETTSIEKIYGLCQLNVPHVRIWAHSETFGFALHSFLTIASLCVLD